MTRRLSAEDRAILALESDVVVGHTGKVVRLDGTVALDALREAIAARLEHAPELTWRLGPGAEEWVTDPELDLAAHVADAPAGAPRLADAVAELFAERLPRDRPLWRIDRVTLDDGSQALVWRIHHALADGSTGMRLARAVLWDEDGPPPAARPARAAAAADERRRHHHALAFVHREFAPVAGRSPFDGAIGRERAVAFATCSLPAVHDAAKAAGGATLNDAVVSVVAGALRRWLEREGRPVSRMRVRVPVSLHAPGDAEGNRDSFFSLRTHVVEADPVVRLREVHAETAARKEAADAREREALLARLQQVSPRLEHACLHLESSAREYALAVSNVPGPRVRPRVLGRPVASLHSLAEIGRHHALRVAVVSLADTLNFGLCADPRLVGHLDALAGDVEAEASALVAATG